MDRKTLYSEIDMASLYNHVEKNLKEEQQQQIQAQMAAQMGMAGAPAPGGQAPVHQGMGSDNPANLLTQ